jgi:anti-anti-sigma factor
MKQKMIAISKVGVHTVLTPQESITYMNCDEMENSFQEALGKTQGIFILDFNKAPFMDSMALELLLRVQECIKERGSQLKIVGLTALCKDIFTATRLINQLHVYPGIPEAIRETS